MSKRFRADNPGGSSGESSSRGGANHQSSSSSSPAEHRNTLAVKRMSAAAKGPPPLPSKPSNSIHLAKPKPDKQGVEISARSPDVDGYQLTEESNRRRLPDDRRERVSVDSDSSESNTGETSIDSEAIHPIIYCARIVDQDKPESIIERYSLKPFENLKDESSPGGESRKPYAIMDALYSISGIWVESPWPINETRDNFLEEAATPLVFGRDFSIRQYESPTMRIHSPLVNGLLRELVQYYPGYDLEGNEVLHKYPYKIISHYYWDLRRIRGDNHHEGGWNRSSKELSFHLSQVISFVDEHYFQNIALKEFDLHHNGRATFDNLWLLFKPGEVVFAYVRGEVAGFIVSEVNLLMQSSTSGLKSPEDRWILNLWNLGYTGVNLTRQASTYFIDRFPGEKDISTLDVIPPKFFQDAERSGDMLISRGKMYYDIICNLPAYCEYRGPIIDEPPKHYTGFVMIDFQSYLIYAQARPDLTYKIKNPIEQANGSTKLGSNNFISSEKPQDYGGGKRFSKFNDIECLPGTKLESTQYLLLLGYVLGFALSTKQWVIFNMNFIQYARNVDSQNQVSPMKSLILDQDTKDLVSAMAANYSAQSVKPWSADLISGKGEGKVVLLHGAPGTGKTLTVECIASEARRPLISLSVADLGINELEMEKKLSIWLARAGLWGAIVMIDEAEIYLETREDKDLARNALVTAFLRTIEYYPGLLFLTTNRPGRLDEAVRSRIHIAVEYRQPNPKQQAQMWTNLINRLEADQLEESKISDAKSSTATIKISDPVKKLVGWTDPKEPLKTDSEPPVPAHNMNGRDIRNALMSAISYAQFDAFRKDPETKELIVNQEHMELVLKNRTGFMQNFVATYGMTSDQLAIQNFQRAAQE